MGWSVKARFSIGLHVKDLKILELFKSYFGVGNIHKQGKDGIQYEVTSLKDLIKIIDHFNKYPLLTQKKKADFILFKEIVDLMNRKEHLTIEGLHKNFVIKAAINRGLSDKLKVAFPNIIPFLRPLVEVPKTFDPN